MRRSYIDQGKATIVAAVIAAVAGIICSCIALIPQLNAKDTDISEAKREIAELKAQIAEIQKEKELGVSSIESNSDAKSQSSRSSETSMPPTSTENLQGSNTSAVMLSDLDYFAGSDSIKTQASDQDNFGNVHANCITIGGSWLTGGDWSRKYALNGQYTRMTGTLYQRYENRSKYINAGTSFEVIGDGKLLYAKFFSENTTGYYPEDFDIDLVGIKELEVKQNCTIPSNDYCNFAIGDCALWK